MICLVEFQNKSHYLKVCFCFVVFNNRIPKSDKVESLWVQAAKSVPECLSSDSLGAFLWGFVYMQYIYTHHMVIVQPNAAVLFYQLPEISSIFHSDSATALYCLIYFFPIDSTAEQSLQTEDYLTKWAKKYISFLIVHYFCKNLKLERN